MFFAVGWLSLPHRAVWLSVIFPGRFPLVCLSENEQIDMHSSMHQSTSCEYYKLRNFREGFIFADAKLRGNETLGKYKNYSAVY